jgi:hypothetical protein
MDNFGKELNNAKDSRRLNSMYTHLNIQVKVFEDTYKVKYNYDLGRMSNVD